MFKAFIIACAWVLCLLNRPGFDTPVPHGTQVKMSIRPVYNGQDLVLKKQMYLTVNGDSVYIDAFRFYITELCFFSGKKIVTKDSACHLVDAREPLSLLVPVGDIPADEKITAISFFIGVDSLSNVSGAMGGDLDPARGMYWAWNSGYVNAKLEGRSSACHTLHHAFEFHIGGYMKPYSSRRKVTLLLKQPASETNAITIHANAAAWFTQVSLKDLNSVVMPSKEALLIADNYQTMFSVAE